jgi:16S rRNA G966 N2-methylase RsmD
LNFAQIGRVIMRGVEQFIAPAPSLSREAGENERYDFVFMDAPYPAEVSAALLARLAEWARLSDNALVCVGHHKHEVLLDQIGKLTRLKYRCFGASCISIYQKQPSDV